MRIMSDSEDKQPKGGETVKSAKKRGETPKTEVSGAVVVLRLLVLEKRIIVKSRVVERVQES